MDAVHKALKDIGLSAREIELYLALLPVGTSHASTLAQRTGMTRSTAQYTCQQLVRKGIVSKSQRKNTYLYTAESPEKLLATLQVKQQSLKSKEEHLHRIMGDLKRMVNPEHVLPQIQFFEGKQGIADLYEKVLDVREPISCIACSKEMGLLLPETQKRYHEVRMARRIPMNLICPSDGVWETDPAEYREVHKINKEHFPFTCDIELSGSMASVFSFDEQTAVGITIRHEEIVRNFQLLFDNVWKALQIRDQLQTPC